MGTSDEEAQQQQLPHHRAPRQRTHVLRTQPPSSRCRLTVKPPQATHSSPKRTCKSQTLMQRLALQQITKLLDQTMLKPAETNMCHSLIELLQQLPNATISAVYEHFGNNNVPCTLVTALGGGGDYLRTLRWIFIEVDVPQTSSRIVVEPRFRESFDVAHPTPLLKKILNAIPEVFVGSTARLRTLVGVLSEHIRVSFHAQGIIVPPWRHEIAMTSKWFPQPPAAVASRGRSPSERRRRLPSPPPPPFPTTATNKR